MIHLLKLQLGERNIRNSRQIPLIIISIQDCFYQYLNNQPWMKGCYWHSYISTINSFKDSPFTQSSFLPFLPFLPISKRITASILIDIFSNISSTTFRNIGIVIDLKKERKWKSRNPFMSWLGCNSPINILLLSYFYDKI